MFIEFLDHFYQEGDSDGIDHFAFGKVDDDLFYSLPEMVFKLPRNLFSAFIVYIANCVYDQNIIL